MSNPASFKVHAKHATSGTMRNPANFKGLDVSVDIVGDFHPSFGQGIVVVSSSALYDIGYFNF